MAAHHTVSEWERGLLLRDGRLERVLEPGRHRIRPRRDRVITVDVRPRLMVVPGQELLTADGVTLRVSVQLRWSVVDARAFVTGAESATAVLYAAVQEGVRRVVAAQTLEALLADRALLSAGLGEEATAEVADLGIVVGTVRARDVMLPGELRKAAADTVVARERGRAELERARSEAAALRAMANTAKLLDEHPSLLTLRTLQAASDAGSTVVLTTGASGSTA